MIIEVYRGDGARLGVPIVEPLLSDDALIHRGRAEMDANAHQMTRVELDIAFRPGLRLGQIVSVVSPASGGAFRGKIIGIQITSSHGQITQRITVERPYDVPTR